MPEERRALVPENAGEVKILGIDPAPSKQTVVWSQGEACELDASEVRDFVAARLTESALLVAWDAPLTFDPVHGFSDRPVDKAVRSWVRENVSRRQTIEEMAVSVLPFAGCSHWAISCHVLGFPFGPRPNGLEIAPATYLQPQPGRGFVVEVHPAVALAALWLDRGCEGPFPRYKGGKELKSKPRLIAERLRFTDLLDRYADRPDLTDDTLDAYMAWWLADRFTRGEAVFVGDPKCGGYLLPGGSIADKLQEKLQQDTSAPTVPA